MKAITIFLECECGEVIEIEYTQRIPAKINCRMEDSQPEQPSSFEPSMCPKCERELDEQEVEDLARDQIESARDNYWDTMRKTRSERE